MSNPTLSIQKLVLHAVQANASDIHLAPNLPPMIRINGKIVTMNCHSQTNEALTPDNIQEILNPIMDETIKEKLKAHWETDFSYTLPDNGIRIRANVFRQSQGLARCQDNDVSSKNVATRMEVAPRPWMAASEREHHYPDNALGAVFRIIPSTIKSLEELNMPPMIQNIALLERGLVLVTGPTGSGKSTTLAAMVDFINKNTPKHIITIEDPIEFIHHSHRSLIRQRELHRDTQGFSNALRSALREDPDVILVGELRDLETIRLAITAAETGHLVLATLHTSSAEKTIHRIVDVFPGDEKNAVRSILSESLEAVIAQTLVPAKNGGRFAAVEVLRATPAIRHLIREDKTAQIISAIQTGQSFGMQTMEQHIAWLVSENKISTNL